MNNKKRVLLIALIAVLVAVMAFALVACNRGGDNSEKSIVVYIGEDKFEITTCQAYLHGVLKEMKANSQISAYEYSGGDASPFVSQIGDLQQDFANYKYYSVWHSIDKFELKCVYNEYAPSRGEQKDEGGTKFVVTTYKETMLYYSGVGVGDIPVIDGATYAVLID